MKVHIPHTNIAVNNQKILFILTRPFYQNKEWLNDLVTIEEAELVLLPFSINFYFENNKKDLLDTINSQCIVKGIKAYGHISGDFGKAFPEFSNIIYFRMGGFASQLTQLNKGFPVAFSDHFQLLYNVENPIPTAKTKFPIIGFCGHASMSQIKRGKEIVKFIFENTKRFLKMPFRKDWEPLFASAYERAKLLSYFENNKSIKTNFIYRERYRAGAQTEVEREKTTLEYYDNIASSDYVLCVRGAGNFSVRLYETLMMGKIPVFVNTDCLLPFEDKIDWKKHMVWVEWGDRKKVAEIVSAFHKQLTPNDFAQLQLNNRKLWKETLSVNNMLTFLSDDI